MRFLITAGPTREPIDPVRYLSNRSSGKMGYALAAEAVAAGHAAVLISGPVNLPVSPQVSVVPVGTSDEMFDAVHKHLRGIDVAILCAAVADYKPAIVSGKKIRKENQPLSLELVPTRDILESLGTAEHSFLLVGFAAETHDLETNAAAKLKKKKCDVIVANDISRRDSGMEADENEVTLFFRNGETKKISRAPKKIIARELIKILSKMREKCLTKKT